MASLAVPAVFWVPGQSSPDFFIFSRSATISSNLATLSLPILSCLWASAMALSHPPLERATRVRILLTVVKLTMYNLDMDTYDKALHEAQAELARLDERRAVLLRLIQNLKDLSSDELYELVPPPGYVAKGITDEIRTIMSLATVHLDAMQIRDALIQRGVLYSSPKNLLINVHTVLGRIGEEFDVIERDGKPAYKAKSPNFSIRSVLSGGNAATAYRGITQPVGGTTDSTEATKKVIAAGLFEPKGKKK